MRHGVLADVFYEPGLPKPAVYALVGEVSSADYVLPLDDDDVFKRNKVEVLGSVLERRRWPLVKHAVDYMDLSSRPIAWRDQPAKPMVLTCRNVWSIYRAVYDMFHAYASSFAVDKTLVEKYSDVLKRLKLLRHHRPRHPPRRPRPRPRQAPRLRLRQIPKRHSPRPMDTTLTRLHAHRPIPLRTRNTQNKGTTDRRRGIVRIFATKNERT